MTNEEKEKILNRKPTELYYRLDDYGYATVPKARVLSGIRELDYDIKGFEMGCITLWTGFTNSGKTTLMTMIAKRIIDQGERVFFFNGEQTKEDFKNNLFIQSSTIQDITKVQYKNSCVFDLFVNQNKSIELNKKYGDKMFIYNNEIPKDIDTLLSVMEEVRQKEKIKIFFLDNFMQIDIKGDNIYQEQTDIMEKLRTYAVNKKVHIHLVAHPRKTERFQLRLSLFDIAGSSNLINKAYNIIVIMRTDNINKDSQDYKKLKEDMLRDNYELDNASAVLEVLKTKGNRCGLVGLKYDKELKTFIPIDHLTSEMKEKKKFEGSVEQCPF